MIETDCYKQLNVFGPNGTRTADLIINGAVTAPEDKGCFPFRRKVICVQTNKSYKTNVFFCYF